MTISIWKGLGSVSDLAFRRANRMNPGQLETVTRSVYGGDIAEFRSKGDKLERPSLVMETAPHQP